MHISTYFPVNREVICSPKLKANLACKTSHAKLETSCLMREIFVTSKIKVKGPVYETYGIQNYGNQQ